MSETTGQAIAEASAAVTSISTKTAVGDQLLACREVIGFRSNHSDWFAGGDCRPISELYELLD
jgi:hypothetical protein